MFAFLNKAVESTFTGQNLLLEEKILYGKDRSAFYKF